MRWILPMGLVFVIASRAGWGAQTPSDLHFRLRLTEGKTRYSTSEPIPFEVSLWSDAPRGRYYASWFDLVPHTAIELKLEPGTGTVNLLELELGFAGSILGSMGYLTASPVVETGNLTEWYRFESPGHFRFAIGVDWVSVEGADRLRTPIHLESNFVEFDVYRLSRGIKEREFRSVLNEIDNGGSGDMRERAVQRLNLLQTRAAAREEVRRYLATSGPAYAPWAWLLTESSELNTIIPLLEAALRSGAASKRSDLVPILAALQTRKQMGNPPERPSDATKLREWEAEGEERMRAQKRWAARDTALRRQ